jgi:hypothetical protein
MTETLLKNLINFDHSLSPELFEITLTEDGPLFGYNKDTKIIVSSTLRPKNGNLVVLSYKGENQVYRFETASGEATLWPGNQKLSEVECNSLFVVISEVNISLPRFDVSTYLIS